MPEIINDILLSQCAYRGTLTDQQKEVWLELAYYELENQNDTHIENNNKVINENLSSQYRI